MVELAIPEDPAEFDRALEALPNRQAVFLLWPREGKPYLARTNVLRKRLTRLLGCARSAVAIFNLRGTASGSNTSSPARVSSRNFWFWIWRGNISGADYRDDIRLRLPPYVKLILSNRFPRTQVTSAHRPRAGHLLRSVSQPLDRGAV